MSGESQKKVEKEDDPVEQMSAGSLPEESKKPRPGLLRTWRDRLVFRLHFRYPNIPWFQEPELRAWVEKDDAEQNEQLRVPADDRVEVLCFWVVEVYGPGEVDALYAGIRQLGWETGHNGTQSLSQWVADQRKYGFGGDYSLGIIRNPGPAKFLAERVARLPLGVSYAYGRVRQISPSLTALMLRFSLDEHESQSYFEELKPDRASVNEKLLGDKRYRCLDVSAVKTRAVRWRREEFRARTIQWVQEHLPGFFCGRNDPARFPTGELMTTERSPVLWAPASDRPRRVWTDALAPYFSDLWTSVNQPGIRLAWDQEGHEQTSHALVHFERQRWDVEHHYGGATAGNISAEVENHVDGVLTLSAVNAYLRELLKDVRAARDGFPIGARGTKAVLRALDSVQDFFRRSLGTPATATEMAEVGENIFWFKMHCSPYQLSVWSDKQDPCTMAEYLQRQTKYLAKQLLAQDKDTRDHLEQLSTILNTQESVRVQRKMEWLTLAATMVALFSLFVAVLTLEPARVDGWRGSIGGYCSQLWSERPLWLFR
ncbi:hypothetical protein OOZ63_18030 [Paucibacter sp. PLA-PC-4]|uniref:hypothetical protein n=1 Tax=Paucibacter sp. PLA-PC-4 TaxID=2993655 RepID=UPI00224B9773|nr:hypothetical protein [Paucibacter sp. PLA-PC-4]MCX2863731.1 hypothetical protein [Paucibacter sp. PLA-PC-4]